MFGKVFRIKSTAALGKHVAVEGILNINTPLGGYLYLDGSLMSSTEIAYLDGVTAGTALASKALVLNASKGISTITSATITTINFANTVGTSTTTKMFDLKYGSGCASSASGLILGSGTSANPAVTSTADAKFIEVRAKTTATSGDNRLGYFRYDIGGAGASGECLRAFTDLTAAAGTARGSQISLQIGDTGYISGLGVGLDAQLYVKNAAVPAGGTYAALNVEIYSEGSSSSIAAVTGSAFIRVANNGNATGVGVVDDNTVLFDLTGFASGAAKLWYDHQGAAPANVEEWIKVRTPAGTRWLALYNAVV